MAQMRRFSAIGLAAILLTFSLTAVSEGQHQRPEPAAGHRNASKMGAQPAAPPSDQALAIQDKLLSQIKLTKSTADHTDIVTAGDIVVLNKDGLMMCSSAASDAYFNTYDGGVLTAIQPVGPNPNAAAQQAVQSAVVGAFASHFLGSFGGSLASSALSSAQAAQNAQAQAAQAKAAACAPRTFVAGEKFWVTGIVAQADGILVSTLSDPYSDVRYYGDIKFFFPDCAGSPAPARAPAARTKLKKLVDDDDSLFEAPAGVFAYGGKDKISAPCLAPPVDDFLKTVAEVISVAPPEDTSNQGSPADQGAQPAAAAAPATAAPAPLPDVAPPPPPADTPPPTIELGQTKDVVIASFGQPVKVVKLGVKEIFFYKDMKVTFTNGKVSNVE